MHEVTPFEVALQGIFPTETDGYHTFSWTEKNFSFLIPQDILYISIEAYSPVENCEIFINNGSSSNNQIKTLCNNAWGTYIFEVTGSEKSISFTVSKTFSPEKDPRELGICIRKINFLKRDEYLLAKAIKEKQENYIKNEEEYRQGKIILETKPPLLAITIEDKCQIAASQPCTYCAWDTVEAYKKEGIKFSEEFIDIFKKYFSNAVKVTDCSIGEPLLNKNIDRIITAITATGANFTFTTNGQLLNEEKQRLLLGKNINITVSLDAITAETYAKYRHKGFEKIITNLKQLCSVKKKYNNWPHVTCAFIVMNSNKHEIPRYIKELSEIGVDCIIFSELLQTKALKTISRISKTGYHFIYKNEIVPSEELNTLFQEAVKIGQQHNIQILINSQNFLSNTSAKGDENLPICSEPWKAVYILGHTLCACCYSAGMQSWHDCPPEQMEKKFNEIFNGEIFQDIRRSLVQGKLSEHCNPACPHVRKANKIE